VSRPFLVGEYWTLVRDLKDEHERHVGLNPGCTLQWTITREPWPVSAVRRVYADLHGTYLSDTECLCLGAVSDAEYLHYKSIMQASRA
jgi:hypothetical protein